MKLSQVIYECNEPTHNYMKNINFMHHKKKLSNIKNRKSSNPEDKNSPNASPKSISPKKRFSIKDLELNYRISQENKLIADKLHKILDKQTTPFNLNEEFFVKEAQKKTTMGRLNKIKENTLKEQNLQLLRRLKDQTSFMSARELDSKYQNEHQKMVNKLRKVKDNNALEAARRLILPTIPTSLVTQMRSFTEAS